MWGGLTSALYGGFPATFLDAYLNLNHPPPPQDLPAEVEAEDNGGGYDDEDFEDYSDEFDGEDEGPPPPSATAATAATSVAPAARPVSSRGGGVGGAAGAVVSPALKMRKTGDVHAPDDKVHEWV